MTRPRIWPSARSQTELPQEDEAEIRLRIGRGHQAQTRSNALRRIRRALQLGGINEITRARHLAWLAYFEWSTANADASAAGEAAAAATATGDLEATIVSRHPACPDSTIRTVMRCRALRRMDEVDALTRSGEATFGGIYAAKRRAGLIVCDGQLGRSQRAGCRGYRESPPRTQRDGPSQLDPSGRDGSCGGGPVGRGAWHHRGAAPARMGEQYRGQH